MEKKNAEKIPLPNEYKKEEDGRKWSGSPSRTEKPVPPTMEEIEGRYIMGQRRFASVHHSEILFSNTGPESLRPSPTDCWSV